MILDDIVAHDRVVLAERKERQPLKELEKIALAQPPAADFAGALRRDGVAGARSPRLIAEVKKASPSKGLLSPDFDPVRLATSYVRGGANAISVLTNEKFFQGSLADLVAVKAATGHPVLRKDFVFDPYQIVEARANGADCVLLIVAILERPLLRQLLADSTALGMATLVEVHDEDEVDRAIEVGASLIGINNRDLRTFQVDLATTERLCGRIPSGHTIVGESGIHTPGDVERLRQAGVDAMLVGESLVTAKDPAAKIATLYGDNG